MDGPWQAWRSRIAAARRRRDDLVSLWQENVSRRRGTDSETGTTTPTQAINQDWPLTKAKIAQLYSQTPEVRLSPKDAAFAAAVPVFSRKLNETLAESSVGTAIEEVLADVVNASGIGGVLVSCERRTEDREVPILDPATLPPQMQRAVLAGSAKIPTETVPMVVDTAYPITRVSPADLLIPSDFTGSNYDLARWLGHDGRMTWEQATVPVEQGGFGLTDDQKDAVLGRDKRTNQTSSLSTDTTKFRDTEVVNFSEVFYWRHYYHPEETRFKAIQRVVFVDGLDDPVINEPYQGQSRGERGMVGVTRLPIRILTLTYISDDALPPSDSTVSRYQVDELELSRKDFALQRKHSIPIRWFDISRVGPNTRALLEKGDFQGMIPLNGPGERAIGEVSRASYPNERFEYDRVMKADLTEIWQVGSNQAGAFAQGERSASEARIIQQNFATRIGQEREKVSRFFLGIAEVVAGHLALYGDLDLPTLSPEDTARLGTWDATQIANQFVYTIRVDSTMLLTAKDRIEQLKDALNLTAQSGFINPKPIIAEIIELSGLDPAKVVIDPQPKAPEPVKLSISAAEDIMNPLLLAALMRTGQAGGPEDVAAAMKAIQQVLSLMPPAVTAAGAAPSEATEPQTPDVAFPKWESAPRIDRRAEDMGA